MMQVLLWRPAEILNGRMAMLGFTIGVGNQLFTHQSVWQQLYFNPVSSQSLPCRSSHLQQSLRSSFQGSSHLLQALLNILGRVMPLSAVHKFQLVKAAGVLSWILMASDGLISQKASWRPFGKNVASPFESLCCSILGATFSVCRVLHAMGCYTAEIP